MHVWHYADQHFEHFGHCAICSAVIWRSECEYLVRLVILQLLRVCSFPVVTYWYTVRVSVFMPKQYLHHGGSQVTFEMPVEGLEPPHLSALEPKSSVSTNSTTRACCMLREGLEPSYLRV